MALSTSQAKLLVGSNCTLDVLKLGRSTWNLFHMSYLPGFSSHIPAGEYENHQKCWLVGDMLLPRKLILLHKHGYVFDLPTLNKTHSPPLFATHVSLIPWRLDVISFCFAGLSKSGFAKGGLSLWTRKIGCDSYIPISINTIATSNIIYAFDTFILQQKTTHHFDLCPLKTKGLTASDVMSTAKRNKGLGSHKPVTCKLVLPRFLTGTPTSPMSFFWSGGGRMGIYIYTYIYGDDRSIC